MDSIVDKLASSYRDIVEATLAEDEVSEEQRAILLTKFVSLFTDKLRLGLAATFGKEMSRTVRTDVSVDDAWQRGEEEKFNQYLHETFYYFAEDALLRATRRRGRYPAKGAKILQSVCSMNKKSLQELKVSTLGKHKLELSEVKENEI